jgi:tRNA (mo5U34)-methyltransferase
MDLLDSVKHQKWFYEFTLPDGSVTESYLPENARLIHTTREKALRHFLVKLDKYHQSALDISCHEGFFSLILKEHFRQVTGVDKNIESLAKAKQISELLNMPDINFNNASLEDWPDERNADFVLCFGLLYHVENPVQVLRKLASLTIKSVCIETQVLPYNLTGTIEDGSYLWQRELTGLFGLCVDYSHRAEGGLTDLALVPSKQALEFLLKQFGFQSVNFYQPDPDDYEQFTRGHRVIVFAEK